MRHGKKAGKQREPAFSAIGNNVEPVYLDCDKKRAAAELSARAAQRLSVLGEMTGGIAHDFRNILAIVDSGLRLAERNSSDPEKVRVFIEGAREGVSRGMRLTSQLLSFARQGEIETRAADANALL